jgi:hypothetical protein
VIVDGCVSSADGSTLVAIATVPLGSESFGFIFTSTNFGISWTQADAPRKVWNCVASSADGHELVGSASGIWGNGIYTSQTKPAPQMNITPKNGNLLLTWIVPSTNFVLQQNSDLTTASWMNVTNLPVLNLTNLQNQVVLSPTNGSSFYRLKTP